MENCKKCNSFLIDNQCYLCEMQTCSTCQELCIGKCTTCPEKAIEKKSNDDNCIHCGSALVLDHSYFICKSCGIVNDNVTFSAAWNYKTTSSSSHEFDGNLTNTTIKGKGCLIDCIDANGKSYKKNLQTIQYQGQYNSERQKYENGIMDIKKIAISANINDAIVTFIKDYWRKFMKLKQNNKGSVRKGIIANCFFYGFIASGFERTIDEVCDIIKIDKKTFKKGEKIMRPVLYDLKDEKLKFEYEQSMYQNKFIRLVDEMSLPFRLSSEMNDLYNKKAYELRLQTTENIVGSIFLYIVQQHYEIDKKVDIFMRLGFKKNSYNNVQCILKE